MSTKFELSIEEMAFIMGSLGGLDEASIFLRTVAGDMDLKELDGRLKAASHSLIARRLLEINIEYQQKVFAQSLEKMVRQIMKSEYSIRCSRFEKDFEQIVSYYFFESNFIAHSLRDGVVSCLGELPDIQSLLQDSMEFFKISNKDTNGVEPTQLGEIPAVLLQKFGHGKSVTRNAAYVSVLTENGLKPGSAKILAHDLRKASWYGSAVKISNMEGQLVSEEGFIFLTGEERYWMFEIIPEDSSKVRVFPGNVRSYSHLMRSLLKS